MVKGRKEGIFFICSVHGSGGMVTNLCMHIFFSTPRRRNVGIIFIGKTQVQGNTPQSVSDGPREMLHSRVLW